MSQYGVGRKGRDFAVIIGTDPDDLKRKCKESGAALASHTHKEDSARRAVAKQAEAFGGKVLKDDFKE